MADATRLPEGIIFDGSPLVVRPLGTVVRSTVTGTLIRSLSSAVASYEAISAAALRETSGPTDMVIGEVAEGQTLVRSGATMIGGASASPAQTIVVAMEGGDYWTIGSGLFAAGVIATAANPVTVIVYPGIYPESNPTTMPEHVSLIAIGRHEVTRYDCLDPNAHGLVMSNDTEVVGLQVRDASGAGFAGFHVPAGVNDVEFHDCKWRDCDIGFLSEAGGVNALIVCREPHVSGGTATDAFACQAGGYLYVEGATCTNDVTITNFYHVDGAGSLLIAATGLIRGAATTRAGLVENTGILAAVSINVADTTEGFVVEATGGVLNLGMTQVATSVAGDHLRLGSAVNVICAVNGCDLNGDNFDIGALATLTGNFQSSSATRPGPTTIGELWLGATLGEQVPVTTYLRNTACTGWVSGGVVSTNAGRVLDVTAGEGLVNTGTGVLDVVWGADTVTADANSEFWVYVTSAGVVSIAMAPVAEETNIILANGFANATDIIFVAAHRISVEQLVINRHDYISEVIGSITQSGQATTLPGLLALDVSSGSFWRDEHPDATVGAAPITFTTWYNDGAWIPTTGVGDMDNADFNTVGVGLGAIPAGEWVKAALWVTVGGDGTQYHLVYPQASYANQGLAEAAAVPTPPDFLVEDGIILAGPTVQVGAAAIASVLDLRPEIVTAGPGTTAAPADHGALAGLADDDHIQYLSLGGNAARNPLTGTLAAAGGTIILPTSAAPAQIVAGSIVYDTALDVLTVGNGAARVTMADTTTAQILTNKTLTTPTVASFVNAQHDHTNAAGGGAIGTSVYTQESSSVVATSFTDVAAAASDLSITADAALAGTNVLIQCRYEATFSSPNQIAFVDLAIDGVKVPGSRACSNASINESDAATTFSLPAIVAGQIITMRWWTNLGTITVGERLLSAARLN